jgi:hypothetical protein
MVVTVASGQPCPVVQPHIAAAQLRAGRFAAATEAYSQLAGQTTGLRSFRYETIADLLRKHPDGQYTLTEPYPASADLLDKSRQQVLRIGLVSLREPMALAAAMRDRAKPEIRAAVDLMDAVEDILVESPTKAKARLAAATAHLNRADALLSGIATSYRPELARIEALARRERANVLAGKFDQRMATLARRKIGSEAYYGDLRKLAGYLDGVDRELAGIVAVAERYPDQLAHFATEARADLKDVHALRAILLEERQILK